MKDLFHKEARGYRKARFSSAQAITLNNPNYPKMQGTALWDGRVPVAGAVQHGLDYHAVGCCGANPALT